MTTLTKQQLDNITILMENQGIDIIDYRFRDSTTGEQWCSYIVVDRMITETCKIIMEHEFEIIYMDEDQLQINIYHQ